MYLGANQLLGTDLPKAQAATLNILNGKLKQGNIPELWDGNSAKRISEIITRKL